MVKPRTSFSLTVLQRKWLEKEAARLGISQSELIRKLVDKAMGDPHA